MKLIIQNSRIAATATDDYTGPDEYIAAPPDFDVERMGEYVYQDGVLTIHPDSRVTLSRATVVLATPESGDHAVAPPDLRAAPLLSFEV